MTEAACDKKVDIVLEGMTVISPVSSGKAETVTVIDKGTVAIGCGKLLYAGPSPAPP